LNSWLRENSNSWKIAQPKKTANPIHKVSIKFMVQNISTVQLGYLSGYILSQLLHTCSLADYKKPEKVLNL